MGNNSLAVEPADGKAARTPLPTSIQKSAVRRSCTPIKNAEPLARSYAHLWGLTHDHVRLDQKKVAQLPLCATLLAPDPEDPTSTTLELDELWSFVLKKANDSWMWMALCRKSRQVVAYAVGDRSRPDVPAVVGGHSRGISAGALLHGFLGGLRSGDSRGTTLRCGPARGEKPPRSSGGITPCANVWPVLSA
jgi:hypothetical protein